MSMKIQMAVATIAAICAAAVPTYAANPTLDITDDATALKVTVPAGCLTSMKLELAYDAGTNAASMYLNSNNANRSAWANARTLSEAVPAVGAEYTVPLSELGVPADASFRLFASSTDFALLDYVDQDAADSDHDTGIPDNVCYAIEFGQYSKPWSGKKYPAIIGTRQPNNSAGFAVQHSGYATGGYFMQRINNQYSYCGLTLSTSSMNTCVFTNKILVYNGTTIEKPTTGYKTSWTTPLGTTGMNLYMGRFPEQDAGLKVQSRWYYLRLYGSDNAALLDYVPAKRKSDNVAGFYDRAAARFVTPSGGGAFAAGSVTNDTFEVAPWSVSDLCSFPRLARVPAVTALDTSNGATLTITVRPGHGAGSKLYLAHDTEDKGDDISDWNGKLEVCSAIPAVGGTFVVDLAAQGLDSGRVFRAFIANRYTLLERVQQNSDDDVIDTGISDIFCHGCEFGYVIAGYSNKYAAFVGSGSGSNADNCGFRFCLSGSTTSAMFGQYTNGRYTWKYFYPAANSRININASGGTVVFNGTAINPQSGNGSWRTSPLGLSRLNAYLGRLPVDATTGCCCYGWWYGLSLTGANGDKLLDYVPVKDSNGTAGFFDRVSASFVTPTSGGSLVAGDAVGEEAWECVSLSETMTCDADMPATAAWIGGTSGVLDNPANWACTNFLGAALPNTTLPVADVTDVTIGGNVSFNCSTAADRIWRNATFLDTTLADACDWSGFGDRFTIDGTLDLVGHALTLAGAPAGGTITSSAEGDPVALRFVIPAGVTNENVNCAITGNLRLFKEGAGMLVATKYPQTYSGGTDIVEGTLKAGVPGDINKVAQGSFFGSLKTLDVRPDGTLDSGGTYYWGYHTINLHGGTLTTSVQPTTYGFNPKIYLTAKSTLEVTGGSDSKSPLLDLGGHTLNINFHNNAWHIFASSATNGNIVATGSGVLNFYKPNGTINSPTCAFDIYPRMNVQCNELIMGDLAIHGTDVTCSGSHVVKVNGRFTPVTQYFPQVQLQDGATLDLSGREGTWPVESLVSACSLSFAANATVTVAVGGRNVPSRLVSWTTMPAGADTLTVLCDNPDVLLEVRADGIYRKRGLMIIVR